MKPLSTTSQSLFTLGGMVFALVLTTQPAWSQGNSPSAHWAVTNILPGLRGPLVNEAAKGTPIIPTGTATGTATLTPIPTVTLTPTVTSTPTSTPDLRCAGKADGATCDAGVDNHATSICVGGACQTCVPDNTVTPRFVDNGDGTITDRQTCLVWEKKTGEVMPYPFVVCTDAVTCSDPHAVNNVYDWTGDGCETGSAADGAAYRVFLTQLNASPGFAQHRDWRLPESGGFSYGPPSGKPAELESLLTCFAEPCSGMPPFIDPIFGPTQIVYWTNTTVPPDNTAYVYPLVAYIVYFSNDPGVLADGKCSTWFVRAVRGGPCGSCTPPQTCGGGGVANQCGCTPTDTQTICSNADQVCGSRLNNCGQEVSCGTCPTNAPKCCVDRCVGTPECP